MNCYGLIPTKLFATYSEAAKGPTWTEIWPYCLVGKGGHLCEHAYHRLFYVVEKGEGVGGTSPIYIYSYPCRTSNMLMN